MNRRLLRVRAILFDLGGTLDGDGVHWLDRFYRLYQNANVAATREQIRAAFDFAEARAARDSGMLNARFSEMVQTHVKWQWEKLQRTDDAAMDRIAGAFIDEVREIVQSNAELLRALARDGFALGVISNGCGNTARLCEDFGFTPHLRLVLDSRCVGLSKPDSRFFAKAAEELGLAAADILMVGDSFERDVTPAKEIGMKIAWLTALNHPAAAADLQIASLRQLMDLISLLE